MGIWSFALVCAALPHAAFANPYPIKELVPKDRVRLERLVGTEDEPAADTAVPEGLPCLRVQVDWTETGETYSAGHVVVERSGTSALLARAPTEDPLGSYKAVLRDKVTGAVLAHDAVGTGQEYRRLTRAMTFRFPVPTAPAVFEMLAENPATGVREKVVERVIDPRELAVPAPAPAGLAKTWVLARATKEPKITLGVYAEGYAADAENRFRQDAAKVVDALRAGRFPLFEHMEFHAAFAPSRLPLGSAKDLGLPVAERDSFLGLYYPYWRDFGRWYHVVYPTREKKFRDAIASVPYDYPIVLVDSDEYWGVGNYKELTAIPSRDSRFTYLLTHEIGHFFGLNEEYEGGGPTELAFAPGIAEPWSQNITFLGEPRHGALKWNRFVAEATPLPTPRESWRSNPPVYGAYAGGYGDTEPFNHSHKPGLGCVMDRYRAFCDVCRAAIEAVIRRDSGLGTL